MVDMKSRLKCRRIVSSSSCQLTHVLTTICSTKHCEVEEFSEFGTDLFKLISVKLCAKTQCHSVVKKHLLFLPLPHMNKTIKWGILGCGKIAGKFASDLVLVQDTELLAVSSRSIEKAKTFGKEFHVSQCYGNYEELVQNPEVDVCYVATIHPFHHELAHLCLDHGKAVLCEKPMGMNHKEVLSMVNTAKEKGIFLMEAMWTRFIPAVEKMVELIREGTIGEIKSVHADFGFLGDQDRNNRLFNKSLGGGALLDIGIYPLYLSLLSLGYPEKISAVAQLTETGVDESCSMILRHQSGAVSSLHCTFMADTQIEGWIHGSEGSIRLHRRFHHPNKISVYHNGDLADTLETPYTGIGYFHEIVHVNECLRNGLLESPKMSLQDSLNLIKMMDEVRDQIGVFYQ